MGLIVLCLLLTSTSSSLMLRKDGGPREINARCADSPHGFVLFSGNNLSGGVTAAVIQNTDTENEGLLACHSLKRMEAKQIDG